MLSPNVIDVSDELAQAYHNIIKVDSLAYASMNTLVGTLTPDPSWLGQIRTRVDLLSAAGAQWQQKKPTIWSEVLAPFNSYYSLFAGVTEAATSLDNNTEAWKELLEQLNSHLSSIVSSTRAAEAAFSLEIENLKNVEQLLSASLDTAWQELASEEATMIKLAAEIGSLQDQLANLEGSLTSTELSDGGKYVKSTVTIAYSLLSSAGESIPYLSIASLLFTVGELAYDMIVTDKEIASTIDKIVTLQNEATTEAQAAAMTKAIIQLIYNFDKKPLVVEQQLPDFSTMWSAEQEKVQQIINAINAGAQPTDIVSLVAMPSSTATWKHLSDLVNQLAEATESGDSVTIVTSDSKNPVQAR